MSTVRLPRPVSRMATSTALVTTVSSRSVGSTAASRAVVVPGSVPKEFPAGTFGVAAALIIGTRKASTDLKTSLNTALREYGIPG